MYSQQFIYAAANAPTGLAAVVVKYSHIKVSWTAPTSGAVVTGYRIVYHRTSFPLCLPTGSNQTLGAT